MEWWAQVIIALVMAAPGLWAANNQRKENAVTKNSEDQQLEKDYAELLQQGHTGSVDGAVKLSDAAIRLLKPYEERVNMLDGRVDELETELLAVKAELERERQERFKVTIGAQDLYAQIKTVTNLVPAYVPPGIGSNGK